MWAPGRSGGRRTSSSSSPPRRRWTRSTVRPPDTISPRRGPGSTRPPGRCEPASSPCGSGSARTRPPARRRRSSARTRDAPSTSGRGAARESWPDPATTGSWRSAASVSSTTCAPTSCPERTARRSCAGKAKPSIVIAAGSRSSPATARPPATKPQGRLAPAHQEGPTSPCPLGTGGGAEASSWGHEGDRRPQPRLGPERGDPTARLHGVARTADQIAQRGGGVLDVIDQERETPEPRRAIGIASDAHALRRLHHLEDRLADAKERLSGGTAGRGALTHAPQLEAVAAQVLHRAVEVRRHQHQVVDPDGPVGVRPSANGCGLLMAERPANYAAARPLSHESQHHGRDPADVVLDVEPDRAPVGGLVGDLELLESRHAGDATRTGDYFGSLTWPGGVGFGAGSGATSGAVAGALTDGAGCTCAFGSGAGLAAGALLVGGAFGCSRASVLDCPRPRGSVAFSFSGRLISASLRPPPPDVLSRAGFERVPAFEWPFERSPLRSAPRRPWLRSVRMRSPRALALLPAAPDFASWLFP